MIIKLKKVTFTLIALILVFSCAYGIFLDYRTAFASLVSYGDSIVVNSTSSTYVKSDILPGTDKVVIVYVDSDGYGRATIGEVVNSHVVYSGSDYTFSTTTTRFVDVVGITSTKFAVFYDRYSTLSYCKVGTVSGTAITWYAESAGVDSATSATYLTRSMARLTDSTFVIAYNSTSISKSVARVCTIAVDNSISLGTEAYSSSLGGMDTSVIALSSSLIVMGSITGAGTYFRAAAGNVSGDTITLGSYLDIPGASLSSTTDVIDMVALSSTKFVALYEKSAKVCTVTPGVSPSISAGSATVWREEADKTTAFSVAANSSSVISVVWTDSTTYLASKQASISDAAITFDADEEYLTASATTTYQRSLTALSDGLRSVIVYRDSSGYASAIVASSQTFPIWEPIVDTDAATDITGNSVTLNGTLDYDGELPCEYRFGIGITSGGDYYYTDWSTGAAKETGDTFSSALTDLWDGQTFYYVAEADNGMYVGTGDEVYFSTTGSYSPYDAPTMATGTSTDKTDTGAKLYGSVTDLGDATTVYAYIQYGTTTAYGSNTAEQELTAIGEYNATITGLAPGTIYHYRAIARYRTYLFATGSDMTFMTTGSSSSIPIVTTLAATNRTTTGATLNGALTTLGLYSSVYVDFEYDTDISEGGDDPYEWSTPWITYTVASSFNSTISALELNNTYHFRARCLYGSGSYAYGSDLTFVTDESGIPPIPPDSLSGGSPVETLPENIVPIWPGLDVQNTSTQTSNPFYEPVNIVAPYTGFDADQIFFWIAAAITLGVAIGTILAFRGHLLISGFLTIATMGFFVAWGIFPYYLMVLGGAYLLASLVAERQPNL